MEESAVILFTGDNTFTLGEDLRFWLQEFSRKHGQENLLRLDAKDVLLRELLDEISSAPFISSHRMIVVNGIPKYTKEDIERIVQCIHPDVRLVFVEPSPDKRTIAVKELLRIANVKEYKPLQGSGLRSWLLSYANQHELTLSNDAAAALIAQYGDNQVFLAQEVQKLSLFAQGNTLSADDVHSMSIGCNERKVWGLMDHIGEGDSKAAMEFIRRQLRQGDSPMALWSVFLWMMSGIVPLYSALSDGVRNPAVMVKQYSVPFGAAKTLVPFVSGKSKEEIQALIRRFASYDMHLKTGGYRSTEQEPQELLSLLDRCVLECCARSG